MKTKIILGIVLLTHIFPTIAVFTIPNDPRYTFTILQAYGFGWLINIGAIAGAFDIPVRTVEALFLAIGVDVSNGASFWECKKVINLLGKSYNYNILYSSNPDISYAQLSLIFKKGSYIFDLGSHLSHLEDGVIYDTYLAGNKAKWNPNKVRPTGWWKIK